MSGTPTTTGTEFFGAANGMGFWAFGGAFPVGGLYYGRSGRQWLQSEYPQGVFGNGERITETDARAIVAESGGQWYEPPAPPVDPAALLRRAEEAERQRDAAVEALRPFACVHSAFNFDAWDGESNVDLILPGRKVKGLVRLALSDIIRARAVLLRPATDAAKAEEVGRG